jgi:D-sedoheptulose 7-phosphate isomerase
LKINFNRSFFLSINESLKLKKELFNESKNVHKIVSNIFNKIKKGGKIFLCGNGGSAADAQHLAAEFLVRLRPHINRKPIAAISLAQDTSTLTACSNDYNFNKIFSRNLEALGNKKDVLIVISTSGNSKNIIEVLKYAKKNNIYSLGLLGNRGGHAKKLCNEKIIVPSNNVARIQECHIFLGHFIFECLEKMIIKPEKQTSF